MKILFTLFLSLFSSGIFCQEFLAEMPEAVSNNAVTGAYVNGVPHVFSFSGIDSTKKWNGIHKRAFKYNIETNEWQTIPELPSGTGRIAAGASTVKDKIYIIGGYEVFQNGNERTLNEVHIYNPETNEYEADGKPIPVPTDDHVQAVYKDSLIYCITGWSQNTNIPNVQIYNPSIDEWLVGTSVPNSSSFKAFGASGTIIGDTIYYAGGARIGSVFPISNQLRKGYINPINPTEITWTTEAKSEAQLYRSACASKNKSVLWFGGSHITYNFDGIAYNGSGGVESTRRITEYNSLDGQLSNFFEDSFPDFMDFRGVAAFPFDVYYFCGGMENGQKVSNKTFKLEVLTVSTEEKPQKAEVSIFPNPASELITMELEGSCDFRITNFEGKIILNDEFTDRKIINLNSFQSGIYTFTFFKNGHLVHSKKVVKK